MNRFELINAARARIVELGQEIDALTKRGDKASLRIASERQREQAALQTQLNESDVFQRLRDVIAYKS